jgi:SAM-dependent methyltransferase
VRPMRKRRAAERHRTTCGCAADAGDVVTATVLEVRETVREKYAAAARAAAAGSAAGCCSPADQAGVFGAALYAESDEAPEPAIGASLGCGVPTSVADLHEGEVVLDLGSGAGADVLISARRVGPTGGAIGIDMTDEMLQLARTNAAEARVTNVEFVKGYLEELPLPDASVDVVISNCVLNLSGDKPKVFAEAANQPRSGLPAPGAWRCGSVGDRGGTLSRRGLDALLDVPNCDHAGDQPEQLADRRFGDPAL